MIADADSYLTPKGVWWDIIERRNPFNGKVKVEFTPRRNNIVTTEGRILMAILFSQLAAVGGVVYHAVGSGLEAWDDSPSAPTLNDFPLVDEIYRAIPTTITFIEPPDTPTVTPTNIVRFTTVLDYGVLTGGVYIREQALFGDANATLDNGRCFNNIRHVKRFKDGQTRITRNVEINF